MLRGTMKKTQRQSQVERRIARAEADCNATVLRAFDRLLRVLERERTEWTIYLDRKKKKVTR